jgi:hypothetical protein
MRGFPRFALMMLLVLSPLSPANADVAGVSLKPAEQAMARKDYRQALETLAPLARDAKVHQSDRGPRVLLLLGESAEAYVEQINARWRKRRRLDPKNAEWLGYLRQRQHWAAKHLATFAYYEPGGRYRYRGDAYRLFLRHYPDHALAHEAAWRLIASDEIAPNEWDPDTGLALEDARRYESFLKQYPRSRHHLAAKLAIGWDYLYASGIMWGRPSNKTYYQRGLDTLRGIVSRDPRSKEAAQARILLNRHAPKPAARNKQES